jgi:hypothetical protein
MSWTAKESGFDSWQGQEIFLLTSVPTLRFHPASVQWVQGAVSPGAKLLGHEADHSPPSSAEVKHDEAILLHPHKLQGLMLNKLSTGITLPYLLGETSVKKLPFQLMRAVFDFILKMEQPGSVLPAYYLTRSLFTSC